jgi:hypothetical protein
VILCSDIDTVVVKSFHLSFQEPPPKGESQSWKEGTLGSSSRGAGFEIPGRVTIWELSLGQERSC